VLGQLEPLRNYAQLRSTGLETNLKYGAPPCDFWGCSVEHKKAKGLAILLAVSLAVSLGLNGYFYLKLSSNQQVQNGTFFSFVFSPTMQNITRGNLYLNMTFAIVDENLTVKAEVNTENYNPNAFLALQFDSDNNGTIDVPYWPEGDFYYYAFGRSDSQFLLRVNNQTTPSLSPYWGWLPDDRIFFGRGALPSQFPYQIKSSFHYCVYSSGLYTFSFTFPVRTAPANMTWPYFRLEQSDGQLPGIRGKLVRALYGIEPSLSSAIPENGSMVYAPPFSFTEKRE
jgi:hypothetical protein